MYKYFMGKRGNFRDRLPGKPLVIETDEIASSTIDSWLDYYAIDFDRLIECIKLVFKSEIIRINFVDKDNLLLCLSDSKSVFLELQNEKEPKCSLYVNENDKFVINLLSEITVEECFEEIKNIRFGVKYSLYFQELFMGNSTVVISIKCLSNAAGLYKKIKRNIRKLADWENVAQIIQFIHLIDNTLISFTVSLTYYDEGLTAVSLKIEDSKVSKYVVVDDDNEFIVESNGDWSAKIDDIMVKYDFENRKYRFIISQRYLKNQKETSEIMLSIKEYIAIMYSTIEILNGIIAEKV